MNKKLTRSGDNRILFGLLGGLGEYFDTDPTLIRLLYLFATIFTGIFPGILAYIVGSIFVPEATPDRVHVDDIETV